MEFISIRDIKTQHKLLSSNDLLKELNYNGFIYINGYSDDRYGHRTVNIFLFAPDSTYCTKSPEFKTLMTKQFGRDINADKTASKSSTSKSSIQLDELIIISAMTLSNHIMNLLNSYNFYTMTYTYTMFMIVVPKHLSVPTHTIADDTEIDEFLARGYKTRDMLPRILHTDPPVVWIGCRPGSVVRIERISENAGIAIVYRLCV